MTDRGSEITMQVIRLRSVGEREIADDIERVQRRNRQKNDLSKYGVLI